MEKKNTIFDIISRVLFILYILLLIFIIVFKLGLPINYRNVNLIPFQGVFKFDGSLSFHEKEVFENMLIFIPYGIFMSILKPKWIFIKKLLPITATSLIFELSQYIFSLGATDINDLISNTVGGIIGITLYYLLFLILRKNTRLTNKIFTILALTVLLIFIALSIIIKIYN